MGAGSCVLPAASLPMTAYTLRPTIHCTQIIKRKIRNKETKALLALGPPNRNISETSLARAMFGIKDNRRVGFASNGGGASRAAPQYQSLRTDDEVRSSLAAPCLYLLSLSWGVWERETTRLTPCYQLTATMRLSYRGGTRDKRPGGAQKGVGSYPSICTAPFASCTGARTDGGGQGKKRLRRHEGFGGGGLPSVCHYLRPRNLQPRGKASLRALGRCGYTPESGRGVSLSFGRHLKYMRPGCQDGLGLVPGT